MIISPSLPHPTTPRPRSKNAYQVHTLSMAKLPMKKKLPNVNVKANLCGLKMIVGSPMKNARAKNTTDNSRATTKPWKTKHNREKNEEGEGGGRRGRWGKQGRREGERGDEGKEEENGGRGGQNIMCLLPTWRLECNKEKTGCGKPTAPMLLGKVYLEIEMHNPCNGKGLRGQ